MPERPWEPELIRLWESGAKDDEMAAALGIPPGTVRSRIYTLQKEGKLGTRPRGGRRVRAETTPAPRASAAVPAPPAPPAMTFVAVPEIQEILSIVKDLQTRVGSLEQTRVPPALAEPPAPPSAPAPPVAERKDIQQWTVRLSKALIQHIKVVAYERRMNPSEVVEEWLWQKAHEIISGS